MTQFLSVVRVMGDVVFYDVPSIQPFIDMFHSGSVVSLESYEDTEREGLEMYYFVTFKEGTTIDVVSWENVHPSDWSPELVQLNKSYE